MSSRDTIPAPPFETEEPTGTRSQVPGPAAVDPVLPGGLEGKLLQELRLIRQDVQENIRFQHTLEGSQRRIERNSTLMLQQFRSYREATDLRLRHGEDRFTALESAVDDINLTLARIQLELDRKAKDAASSPASSEPDSKPAAASQAGSGHC